MKVYINIFVYIKYESLYMFYSSFNLIWNVYLISETCEMFFLIFFYFLLCKLLVMDI